MLGVRESTATPVTVVVEGPAPPSGSASYSVLKPGGQVLTSSTASAGTVSTTVTAWDQVTGTVTVADGTGIVPGMMLFLGSDTKGWALVEVSSRSSTAVVLVEFPPFAPASGDALRWASYAITLPAIATRGRNYRVELTGTRTDSSPFARRVPFDVVRSPWEPSITADDVRAMVSALAPSATAGRRPSGWYTSLARRADQMVLAAVRNHGTYPDLLFIAQSDFAEAARYAARACLVDAGLLDRGPDAVTSQDTALKQMRAEVYRAIEGLAAYDADDTGAPDASDGFFQPRFTR